MVIVSFNGFEVIQLISEGGWGGDFPPGGLNRVKARLSPKPLNSRVTHFDNERVFTWRPFEVRVFELGRRSCFLRKLETNLPRRKNRESPGNEIGWVRGSGHFPKWRLLYPTRSSLECRYIPPKKIA